MNKIFLIFKREYLTRVKKKSFIIATLLVPLGFLLMIFLSVGLASVSKETLRIAVVDEQQLFEGSIPSSRSGNLHFVKKQANIDELRKTYQEQNFDGVLYIPQQKNLGSPNIRYISEESLGLSSRTYIQRKIKDEIRKIKLTELGVNNQEYKKIQNISVDIKEQSKEGEDKKGGGIIGTGIATATGYMMGMMMYFVIFVYGTMVMYGVMEEKTNRIVEVLLSSVRPFKLMLGKILGIGAVGITQLFIWIVLIFLIQFVAGLFIGSMVDTSSIDSMGASPEDMENIMGKIEEFKMHLSTMPLKTLLFGLVFYFFGGYMLYAAMFAAMASAVNEQRDMQSFTLPITIPVIIALFIMIAIIDKPNSGLAIWSSIFPFFSPIVMPARMAFGVPFWQLALSMIALIIGIIVMVWLSAKIYRVGILMHGKKPSFKEIAKWLTYSG